MNSKILCSLIVAFLLFVADACNNNNSSIYNITDFGARGDGKKINTKSINEAVRKCSNEGGGTVVIPRGIFITGTIVLRSGVNLHLEPGAILTGSIDTSDYLIMNDVQFSEGYSRYGLIFAKNVENISITGYGEINGNGTFFMNGIDKPHMGGGDFDRKFTRQGERFMKPGDLIEDGPVSYNFRPGMLITLEYCGNIRISDVTMKDSPEWTIRLGTCDNAVIHGITIINNKLIPNSDGIHCTTSRNIMISDCNIFAGDDAVIVTGFGDGPLPQEINEEKFRSFKGNRTGWAENVTVTNCVLSSRSACIRVGYGNHPIRNLTFSNIIMYDSNRGIGVFARDDSRVENVLFSDIVISNRIHSGHWWGKGESIHISAIQDTKDGKAGTIDNIRFRNITAQSEAGIVIYGTPGSTISNIYLEDIKLRIGKGEYTETYGGNFDLRPAWPLSTALFSHDIPGIYAGFVNNLTVRNFQLTWDEGLPEFFTEAVYAENFNGIKLDGIDSNPAHCNEGDPVVRMTNGENAIVSGIRTSRQNIPYLMLNVK
jgi:polygalacturonase